MNLKKIAKAAAKQAAIETYRSIMKMAEDRIPEGNVDTWNVDKGPGGNEAYSFYRRDAGGGRTSDWYKDKVPADRQGRAQLLSRWDSAVYTDDSLISGGYKFLGTVPGETGSKLWLQDGVAGVKLFITSPSSMRRPNW
jgi:hypothetical protein